MIKINWALKLSSRKFWVLIIGVTIPLGALLSLPDSVMVQVVSLITAASSVVFYLLAESYVDGQRVKSEEIPALGGDE